MPAPYLLAYLSLGVLIPLTLAGVIPFPFVLWLLLAALILRAFHLLSGS